ncbi:MAG: choice-of-anchor B family protein [Bacteroidia bacterium]
MRKIYLTALMLFTCVLCNAQNFNLTLQDNITYPGLANIGGYVDGSGNEYALVGTVNGLSIVDVTTPTNAVEIFAVPGVQSDWREVKTWLNYAYVTTEGGNGLQIIDMTNLPASYQVKQYLGNGAINGQIDNIHALHIDNGYCYLYGSNLFNGAAVILDLNADPWNPNYLGHTPDNGSSSQSYIHDGYVRNDTLWAGYIYIGEVRVYNCANKANPVLLTSWTTPGTFTHNTWLSQDSHTLFTTDEVNDSYLTSYDVTNLANVTEFGRFQTTPGSGSIVHNTHIVQASGGEFAVTSWYKDGVVITDVTRPENMVQTGRYDTYTQGSGGGFDGDWGVYPFLPSGTIVASDMSNGLFVLAPTYVRACYLEGIVTDSVTGLPLNNAIIQILTTALSKNSNITGEYKMGTITAGTYSVQCSKAGYITKTATGVVLSNGVLTIQDFELAPVSSIVLTGQVVESGTLNPIPFANVIVSNGTFQNNLVANASGNFAISNFVPGIYDVVGGKWGWRTNCLNTNLTGAVPIQIVCDKGYYDDFIFDFNWTTASGTSANDWERGEPIGTTSMGTQANPEFDVPNDCGVECYVTDNGGGTATQNDVDEGYVDLLSPVFDATLYTNPQINYYRWFADLIIMGNGNPADTMKVFLTNGITTVTLETILVSSPNNSSWVARSYVIANYLTPTANMQLWVRTADFGPVYSIVEAGLDKFEVVEGPLAVNEIARGDLMIKAFPNPFSNSVKIEINTALISDKATLVVTDVTGRILINEPVNKTTQSIELGDQLAEGIYFVRLLTDDNGSKSDVLKITKTN